MRGGISKGVPPKMSIIMQAYLKEQGSPATISELTRIVRERRPDLKSKQLEATVRSIIYRTKEFIKISPGVFSIRR